MSGSKANEGKIVRKKTVLPLMVKLEMLDRIRNGESYASIGRIFNVNESSVRTIKKSEEKIRNSVACNSLSSKVVRDPAIEKMEAALVLWINDRSQAGIELTNSMIREEAKRLFEHFKSANRQFQASKGWFHRFKTRLSQDSIKIVGDISATTETTYPDKFPKLISTDDGSDICKSEDEEVFSEDETDPLAEIDWVDMSCLHSNKEETPTSATNLRLNLKSLKEGLRMANEFCDFFIEIDPSTERSHAFKKKIIGETAEYQRELERFLESSKQQKITKFFKPVSAQRSFMR